MTSSAHCLEARGKTAMGKWRREKGLGVMLRTSGTYLDGEGREEDREGRRGEVGGWVVW